MKVRLKKLSEQVMVITGASSGIGLVTARQAARRGARLVLAARSEPQLRQLVEEIQATGGQAVAVVADVGREEDVRRIADAARERFGGFDTWVNNAGLTLFGRLEEISLEDARRLFDTNFWGVVHGSLAALPELKKRGGALINVGSVVSDRAFPVQGMYSASKHAVKGFTDALRVELQAENAPVSVTLIKPTSIATPLNRHAGNYLPVEPTLPPPVYAPETVAAAILHCAEHPEREVAVGGASAAMSAAAAVAPGAMDSYQVMTSFRQQQTDQPARGDRQGILYRPSHDLAERGEYPRHVFESSAYTSARLHPLLSGAAVLGAGLLIGGIWSILKSQGESQVESRG
jgi:short-subunit dehydrogenase